MTRLTEALERAQIVPASAPVDKPSPAANEGVPGAWRFDVNESAGPAAQPASPSGPSDLMGTAPGPYSFASTLAGKLIVGEGAAAGLIEQYRRLAAVMHHAQTQRGVRSVMIASAVAAEGKTLTATNLALTLSQSFDRRVLLIDADLRRPGLHEMFQLPNEQGIVDSLRRPDGGRLPVHAVAPNLW